MVRMSEMPENANPQERMQSTGTWNIDTPIDCFAAAIYHDAQGRVIRMPVAVAGDKITWQRQETALPRL